MDIKLNTGVPLDRSLIPKPKFKVGDKIFCARSYFSEVRTVEIKEINLTFNFTDNGYITHYECDLVYQTYYEIGSYEDYKEEDLYLTYEEAQERLLRYRQEAKAKSKVARDEKIIELTKNLERLIKLRDEQEQGQGSSDGITDKKDVSTIFPISENSPTSK